MSTRALPAKEGGGGNAGLSIHPLPSPDTLNSSNKDQQAELQLEQHPARHPARRTHNDPGMPTLHLFSQAVATAETRKVFVANILAFTAKWGFDG